MGALHLLPGTTFSNVEELGDYDPKRHAALTLRELERYIALEIVGSYHQSIHSGLGRPPIAVWKEHEGHSGCHRTACVFGWPSCPRKSAHCEWTAFTCSACDTGPPL